MFRFVFCAVILSGSATAQEERNCPIKKHPYRATVRHVEKGGIGYEDGYTTLEIFFSSDPNRWTITPFLDARGHVFDNGKWAANVGTGLRTLWGNRAYGINTYYDYRYTGRFHSNQIGTGFETLGELFDFRLNGYLPVGAKTCDPYDSTFRAFSGNYMLVSQKIQSAMKGANAEFGFHFGKSSFCDFYAAVGPYYFIGKFTPAIWGGKARISGTFKDLLTLEISDSYDRTFRNKFQGQLSINFALGPKPQVKAQDLPCKIPSPLNDYILQPVGRQEIIVIDKTKKNTVATDPSTGLPYFFVFVDNTSQSNGTYESPYHSFAQAQNHSSPNDIIYVFPGDGTTNGMDSGIALKANQKLWGSGISHSIQTSQGTISLPAQSSSSPIITNTNVDTEGNAITLASNNAISGITFTSAINDAIYGANAQNLAVSFCTFESTTTFPIEATFSGATSVSITNNQFLDNVNGVSLTLNGTSNIICSDNTFKRQTSVSNVPVEISTNNNTLTASIQNNVFDDNTTGSIRFNLQNTENVAINVINNIITSNGTGSQSTLGSSFVILSDGTNSNCSINLEANTFSNNTSNSLYMHTAGTITTLEVAASQNTMSNNGGSALVLATPSNHLTLLATDNVISTINDNGIATISSGTTSTGMITIKNNTLTDIGNSSNGIAINQDFSSLDLIIQDNEISRCEGTGILSYASSGITNLTMTIAENRISDCQNLSSNASPGIDIEQYTSLVGSVINNTLSSNTGTAVFIGSSLTSPTTCLTLTGNNSSTGYILTNPLDGTFNLSPCSVDTVNTGTINTSGAITSVQSCPDADACPP